MDLENVKSHKVLDTRGLTYPMQLCKIETALRDIPRGNILEIWDLDPDSKKEIPALARGQNNEYLGSIDDPEGYSRYFIKKG